MNAVGCGALTSLAKLRNEKPIKASEISFLYRRGHIECNAMESMEWNDRCRNQSAMAEWHGTQ
jgi:hypothetical protein